MTAPESFFGESQQANGKLHIFAEKMSTPSIYQLQVRLRDVDPKVYRQIAISSETHLVDLHKILQVTVGWLNDQLHYFEHGGTRFLPPDATNALGTVAYTDIPVRQFLKKTGDEMRYVYNFESPWIHDITLVSISEAKANPYNLPYCLEGEGAAPPEDIGGAAGYSDMLAALASKRHPRYKMYVEYLGSDEWDPLEFNRDMVNELLQEDNFGVFDVMDLFSMSMEGLDGGETLQEAVERIISSQIESNDPPQTRQNYDRLVALGWSKDEAYKLVSQCLVLELFLVVNNDQEFDIDRYTKNLNALPNEPREMW